MKNFYDILDVKSSATPDEIKRAYRKLASQHHPDKGGDVKKFQEIEEAYRTLSDPNLRAQHDNPHRHFGGHNQHGFNFESIFDIFGARFQHPNQHRQKQRAMLSLWITLRDAVAGGQRTVSIGTHQGTQAVEIDIPTGINDGESVQYPKIGPEGMDLIVTFRIHPNPKWQRQGPNLTVEQDISVWDLILGGDVAVQDILGNQLTITIPPRTQSKTTFRLKGRGLGQRGNSPGDMFVRVNATIPNHIPQPLIEAISQNRPK